MLQKRLCFPYKVSVVTLRLSNMVLVLFKELCPLLLQKKLLLLLLMLIRGAMICMGKEFSPRQCDVLPLGIAVITIMKVAVINQHHSHYLY